MSTQSDVDDFAPSPPPTDDKPTKDKVLPNSVEAEIAVLGGLGLLGEKALPRVEQILGVSDFFRGSHRMIFRATRRVGGRGVAVDPLTITEELRSTDELDKIPGGAAYVASLIDGVPRSVNLEHYAGIVREQARRRELITRSAALNDAAWNGQTTEEIEGLLGRLNESWAERDAVRPLPAEDLADILARPTPTTPWAVEGLLAEGDLAILSGPGGIGKSWLALAAALALATGADLFGRYQVGRPYRIAVLDLESRPWELDQRLHRLSRGMGLSGEDLRDRVRVVRQRVRLDRSDDLRRLVASLKEWRSEFFFLDSLRRTFAGNENDSAVVSDLFVNALDPLRTNLGCGVILTDHVRKITGERDLDAADVALRGSTDKRNLCDAHFGVGLREERLAFTPTKTRHSRLPEPILLELTGLGEDEPQDGPVTVSYAGALDRASDRVQDAILALLEEAGSAGLLRGEILGRLQYSPRAATEGLGALKRRGRVTPRAEGKQSRYYLQTTARAQSAQTSALPLEGAE